MKFDIKSPGGGQIRIAWSDVAGHRLWINLHFNRLADRCQSNGSDCGDEIRDCWWDINQYSGTWFHKMQRFQTNGLCMASLNVNDLNTSAEFHLF